jgi:hypothetical protein
MNAERCTLEKLLRLDKDANHMRETLLDMQGELPPEVRNKGSLAAAVDYLRDAIVHIDVAYNAYIEALMYGEIEEEACQ